MRVCLEYELEFNMVSRLLGSFNRWSHDRRCRQLHALSSAFVDGELDQAKQDRVKAHMGICPPCSAFIESLIKTVGLLRSTPKSDAPGGFRQRVRDSLKRERGE